MRKRGLVWGAVVLSAVALCPPAAVGEQLPWSAWSPAPALAGVHLGDSRDVVERVLGKPDRADEFGEDQWDLAYERRGIQVQGSAMGASAVFINERDAGELGGFRVGDRAADVVRKWGEPTTGGLGAYVYEIGTWQVAVQEDDRGRIVALGVSRTLESIAPAAESAAPPASGVPPALKGTMLHGTYTSPDGSVRFTLPLPAAPDTVVEDKLDEDGLSSVVVSAESLHLRFGFFRSRHPWAKSVEDLAAREKFSGSVSEEWVPSRHGRALVRSVVLEIPEWKKVSRSGQIVVYHGGVSYECFYHYDTPAPLVEPAIERFTSLDQMLRAMFESLEIDEARSGQH